MKRKHQFRVGQRVRPSPYGIERNIFTKTREQQSGVVVKVDDLNTPTVRWDGRKTASSYYPGFIMADRRRTLSLRQGEPR